MPRRQGVETRGNAIASGTRSTLNRSATVHPRVSCSPPGRGLVSGTLLLSPAGGRSPSGPGVEDTRRQVHRQMMLDTAVIPCGGLGTRLHPITRWLPKEVLPVALRPVLHWTLDEAAGAGLLRAIVVTNPHKPLLEVVARSYEGPLDLEFVPQDHPRGLGDALLRTRDHLAGSPFVAILPDNLFSGPNPTSAVLATYRCTGLATVLLTDVSREESAATAATARATV